MSRIADDRPAGDSTADATGDAAAAAWVEWLDGNRRAWQIGLAPERLLLSSGADVVELPANTWARDIYVVRHGDGFIVRFETFDFALGFIVSNQQAAPFLTHIGWQAQPVVEARPVVQDEPQRDVPLLWPKVSPLAVWGLISSSLVFVPVFGVVPAIATVILLVLHRKSVRRARAFEPSRSLCTTALVFMCAGLPVSILATWGMAQERPAPVEFARPAMEIPQDSQPRSANGSFFERERNWGLIAAALLVILASLTVHEAAHAVSAWWLGDDLARRLGRVTLNPIAHIDPIGTLLLPLVLALAGQGVFGWARPVPVRMEGVPRPRRAHILVSIAGPGSNLLLAAASLLLLLGLGTTVSWLVPDAQVSNFSSLNFVQSVTASGFVLASFFGAACTILKLGFIVNVFLAFFNLIPIPPLDGSWVLEHLFPRTVGPIYQRIRPYSFLLFIALIYSGALMYLLLPAFIALLPGLLLLNWCTAF